MWYIVSYSREMAGGRRIFVEGIRITLDSLLNMFSAESRFNYIIHSAVLETDKEEREKCWKMYDGTEQAKLQKEKETIK